MVAQQIAHPSLDERRVAGKQARGRTEPASHGGWRPAADRPDPVALLEALVEAMTPLGLTFYARICGWTLARAHARSGDPVAIAEYLGGGDAFDQSITDFCERYADQNEKDYQQFVAAVRAAGSPPRRLRTGLTDAG